MTLQSITLTVEYDPETENEPRLWNWQELLGCEVRVYDAGEPYG